MFSDGDTVSAQQCACASFPQRCTASAPLHSAADSRLLARAQEPIERGYIGIHSVLTYKRFQSLMSQKTGLPANQLSAVFVCRRTVCAARPSCRVFVRETRRCPKKTLRAFFPRERRGFYAARAHCLALAPRSQVNDVEKRQKLPVNENTNFNIILNQHNPSRERDAHFLISVKKSKKDRKGAALMPVAEACLSAI